MTWYWDPCPKNPYKMTIAVSMESSLKGHRSFRTSGALDGPQIVRLLISGHHNKGRSIYRNSHVRSLDHGSYESLTYTIYLVLYTGLHVI